MTAAADPPGHSQRMGEGSTVSSVRRTRLPPMVLSFQESAFGIGHGGRVVAGTPFRRRVPIDGRVCTVRAHTRCRGAGVDGAIACAHAYGRGACGFSQGSTKTPTIGVAGVRTDAGFVGRVLAGFPRTPTRGPGGWRCWKAVEQDLHNDGDPTKARPSTRNYNWYLPHK